MSTPPSNKAFSSSPRVAVRTIGVAAGLLATASLVWTLGATPPNLDRVLDSQRALVAEQPRNAERHNDLGNLLVVAERFDEAEAAYRRAVELHPSGTSARFNLGLLLQQIDRADEAAETFEMLIEIDPRHAWAHYQLGTIAIDRDRRSQALESYARAFAFDPNLSFADVNPHVIDNPLATEALLMSSRYVEPTASRVPRHYDEADRIAEMMLEIEAEEAEEAEGVEDAGEVEVVEGEPEMSEDELPVRSVGSGSSTGSGARFDSGPTEGVDEEDDFDRVELDRRSVGRAPAGEESRDIAGVTRVLTNEDLDTESEIGQVTGGGQQPRARRPQRRSPIDRTPPTVTQPAPRPQGSSRNSPRGGAAARQAREGIQGAPVSRPPRYRPSRRSTASLSLELLPIEPRSAETRSAESPTTYGR
ncbi:MAG: tetratricopeptide repeat protein [Acidobacteriota bacterium]